MMTVILICMGFSLVEFQGKCVPCTSLMNSRQPLYSHMNAVYQCSLPFPKWPHDNPKLSPQGLSTKTSVLQDKRPTNATYGYDFRETSAASHDVVVEKVKKIDFGDSKDFTGVRCIPGRSPAIAFSLLSTGAT